MVYEIGGSGVKVGSGDAVKVGSRVCVWVGVVVMVGVTVGSTTLPLLRRMPKTTAAPIPTSRITKPKAIGKLSVISGSRGPWMDLLSFPEGDGLLNVCPQTWQREALSLTFEPQVGQVFVEGLLGSSVIMFFTGNNHPAGEKLYHSRSASLVNVHDCVKGGLGYNRTVFSIYIHFPFCEKRCSYCDFFTRAEMQPAIPDYVNSLVREIRQISDSADQKISVHTVFFGGGTPSLLSSDQAGTILDAIGQNFKLLPGAEISLEANPGTVSLESLQGYRDAGINRISFGVQSFQDAELQFLGRIHSSREAVEAFELARSAGYENINLDLIFGLPGQTINSWDNSLEQAVELEPEHLSLYALTIEEGTPLHGLVKTGRVTPLDDDISADMYQLAEEKLASAGYTHYEVSNWAAERDGKVQVCIHNLQTWFNLPYLGIGAGAHGCAAGYRYANVADIAGYIRAMAFEPGKQYPFSNAVESSQAIDHLTEMNETMMLGLRLLEQGVSAAEFSGRFGTGINEVYSKPVTRLISQGLLEWKEGSLRLTQRGHLLGNRVFQEFV